MSLLEDEIKRRGIFKVPDKDSSPQPTPATPAVPPPPTTPAPVKPETLSEHFTWKDALFLPQWKRLANESDGLSEQVKTELKKLFSVLEEVRKVFNKPIIVHCAYRPPAYNKLVDGAPRSAHLDGKAVDFHVQGIDCDTVRSKLVPILESLKIRMEDKPGSNWVHVDTRDQKPRFFKP